MVAKYEVGGVWREVERPIPLREVMRACILNALAYTNGSQRQAALLLGINYATLSHRLDSLGIPKK